MSKIGIVGWVVVFWSLFGLVQGSRAEEVIAPKEILIGDTVSFVGPYSIFGGLSSFGTKAAIQDINEKGGVFIRHYKKRIPVKWITRDCQSDPLKVAPLTEELVLKDKVHLIGGLF